MLVTVSAPGSLSKPLALLWGFLTGLGSRLSSKGSCCKEKGKLGVGCSLTLCQPSCQDVHLVTKKTRDG